ncbi:MAG: DHH family phosphoesterase [Promethearchaeota archaeon]
MRPNQNQKQPNFKKIVNSNDPSRNKNIKNQIRDLQPGDYYKGTVKILRKVKPGPLILSVFDGSGKIDAIARDSLFNEMKRSTSGITTYDFGNIKIKDSRKKKKTSQSSNNSKFLTEDDIHVDDVFEIQGKIGVHRDKLEIELDSLKEATMDFNALIKSQSEPIRNTFSIKSERYEAMKPVFLRIAQRIRHAIIDDQPIVIRHHNDADGICAGLTVEQAVLNLMKRQELPSKNRIYRSPNITPFFDQIDLFRDISKFTRYSKQFGDKSPLLLLLDTGSTPENHFALQVLQSFKFECIIVDHHNPGSIKKGKSMVCDLIEFHLNPYLFGYDSQTCGGMLCYELARFIDEEYDQPIYPAVAALGDRCDIPEVDLLIAQSKKSREKLYQMAIVLDYLAFHYKFDPGEGVYEKVFTDSNILKIIGTKVKSLFAAKLDSMLPHIKSEDINGICFTIIELEKFTQRGKYPTSGKVLGMAHDYIVSQNDAQPVFTVGYFGDGIIIRASQPILPVPILLEKMEKELPNANVEGGGHEQAGSIKFISVFGEDVLNFIKEQLHQI